MKFKSLFQKKYRIRTADYGMYEIQVWGFFWFDLFWSHYSYAKTEEDAKEQIARYEASDAFKPKVIWP